MIGTSLGPYKIIEQLGAGGMGEVVRFIFAKNRLRIKIHGNIIRRDRRRFKYLVINGKTKGKSVYCFVGGKG